MNHAGWPGLGICCRGVGECGFGSLNCPHSAPATQEFDGREEVKGRASIGFATATVGLLVAAPFLAQSASEIAKVTGISATFVRLGAFDLAVGNLFGSNTFNMAAFFFVDIAYHGGPFFNAVSDTHAMTALWSILLMSIGLMGIIYRVEERYILIKPDSFLIILGYCLGLWLLFQ
jgi:cation:H+ antiporter